MAKTATKTAKSKFETLISRNGDAIIDSRGARIVISAKNAQEGLVRDLIDDINKLEDKREVMLDQSPDNRYSLKVGENFDAKQWTKDYQSLSVQLANKRIELKIAEENLTDLFSK
jgi:hypothetical protein